MSTCTKLKVLLSLCSFCHAAFSYDVSLSRIYFDGGMVFFPVKRANLQRRLDAINIQSDMELFVPRDPVLQHVIGCDEHIIFIVFGKVEAVTFKDVLTDRQKDYLSAVDDAMSITIPYLSSRKDGEPQVSLQLAVYKNDSREFIEPNAIFPPPVIADRLIRVTNGSDIQLIFEKDDLRLHLIGEREDTCPFTEDYGEKDVNEYEHELQISQTAPDFSVCDSLPDTTDVDFCRIYRDPHYSQTLTRAGSNVCEYWKPTNDVKSFKGSFRVADISDEMRELLTLESTTQKPVEAELQRGTFEINLVFPCIE